MKHLPNLSGLSRKEVEGILSLAFTLKKNPKKYENRLKGKTLAMWFEKPSLRTRISFDVGMTQLGGHAIYLDVSTTHGKKASLKDEVKCLGKYVDIIMARVFEQRTIDEMVKHSSVPVINGLSNTYHPCQALADAMTIIEHVGKKATVAYVGDGNNVCNSLISACKMLGIRVNVATPSDLKPISKPDFWTPNPKDAVKDADVVYTDTWISMGQESEKEEKIRKLRAYQVNRQLIGNRYFMHCLPAIRNQEVTDDVIDSSKSLVYEQAENRLHAQKALMLTLLEK